MWILRMSIWVIAIIFITFISLNGCGEKEVTESVAVTDSGAGSDESTDSKDIKKEVKLPENLTATAYYNFGLEQIKKGRFDEAIAAWEKAIELEPTMANAYEKLGKAYYTEGRFQKAGEIYRKELELKPNDPMIYFSLGVVYRMNEQYEDAVKMLIKALDLNPNLASSYNELGLTYCKQKKLDEAISAHKRALELDPKLGTAHNYLGVVYLLKGMSAEAQEEFEQYKKYEAGKNMPRQHGDASGH